MSTILFPVDFIENQIAPPDLRRICRICMGCSPVMSDIFMDLEGQPVNEFIMECFPVRIQRGEKLPELICSPCLEKLLVVRQFRILCLHSDRCLRNELSTILENQSNISVLPVSNVGHTGNETFIDSSGNQVILLANPTKEMTNEEEEQTYYILQQEEPVPYQPPPPQQRDSTESTIAPEVIKREELILIEDDDSEIADVVSEVDSEGDVVITKVLDNKKKGKRSKKRASVQTNTTPKKTKLSHETNTTSSATNTTNNNSPEFQFVDINAASTRTASAENLIEILEDERGEKTCEKCSEPFETTTLEHNLVCSSNFRDCQFCGLGELNVINFDNHIREMHIKDYRVCQHCRYVFLEEKHYQHHYCKHLIIVDFDVNNYTCAFCRLTFDSLKAFTHHYYKEHHKKSNCLCNTIP